MRRPAYTDYQFLLGLADRLELSTDPEERAALIAIRERIVEIGEQRNQSQQMAAQQVQAVLQEVLQAPDTDAALQENIEQIDEMFLAVLASNIKQAEQSKATFAVQRLRTIYEKAIAILEERMPPEMKLLNRLLSAPMKVQCAACYRTPLGTFAGVCFGIEVTGRALQRRRQ